jgi:hypothetical protein
MGQAALKYDEFDELDQVPIPEGGIATFLTAETGSWADDDDVPPKGITNVVKIADKLAEYGRNEDEYMVHAAEGETVIPMEVFNQNPALKDKLFAEMRIMGIEPERYVVGNELNSINPVTGQPEFFLKKLFRGLKKIVKAGPAGCSNNCSDRNRHTTTSCICDCFWRTSRQSQAVA